MKQPTMGSHRRHAPGRPPLRHWIGLWSVWRTQLIAGIRLRWAELRRGRWPYPLFYLRRSLSTRHPVTYTEKLHYKMVRDRRPILHTFADKVAVRDYIADRVGDGFLTRIYAIVDRPAEIGWTALPRQYVCKPAHSWGRAILVREAAAPTAGLPGWAGDGRSGYHVVHPDLVDVHAMEAVLTAWQRTRHGWGPGSEYEWCYRRVKPRVLVEELLEGPEGNLPDDIKCFVFNGRCRVIRYVRMWRDGRAIPPEAVFMTPSWELVPGNYEGRRSLQEVPAVPAHLGEVLRCAEALGRETDFVRVDFLALGPRLLIGELTSTPAAGSKRLGADLEERFGKWWTVPRRYR